MRDCIKSIIEEAMFGSMARRSTTVAIAVFKSIKDIEKQKEFTLYS
jgi:hypothetical protein